MADESKIDINYLYEMIDDIRGMNDEIRDKAFNSGREDLWRTYEVGHAAQIAVASYVVAMQSLGEIN